MTATKVGDYNAGLASGWLTQLSFWSLVSYHIYFKNKINLIRLGQRCYVRKEERVAYRLSGGAPYFLCQGYQGYLPGLQLSERTLGGAASSPERERGPPRKLPVSVLECRHPRVKKNKVTGKTQFLK